MEEPVRYQQAGITRDQWNDFARGFRAGVEWYRRQILQAGSEHAREMHLSMLETALVQSSDGWTLDDAIREVRGA